VLRSISSNENFSGAKARAKSPSQPTFNSHFQPAGTTTYYVRSSTSGKLAIRRTIA
jgi:hypothetical protein